MHRLLLTTLTLSALSTVGAAQFLVAIDSGRAISTIDPATGAKTVFATATSNASTSAGLAYDSTTRTMYLTSTGNDSLYTLDLATGTATLIGAYGNPSLVMHGLELDTSTAQLYGVSQHDNGLYAIDRNTGAATLIGTSGLSSFTNLGYDSINRVMYATNSGADSFYRMHLATGAATLIGPLTGPTNPNGLAFDSDTATMYLVDNSTDNLYTIDLSTGAATLVGSNGSGNLLGLAYLPRSEGGFARLAHGCGPTTISPIGLPRLGHTFTVSLGATTGTPFVGLGINLWGLPYCGCTIGHDWFLSFATGSLPVAVPNLNSLRGLTLGLQGLDFLGSGGCPSPQLTLTDTIVMTIG